MFYITGDTHGVKEINKLSPRFFPDGKTLNRNDYVIICGDFGLVWDGSDLMLYWLRWLNNQPWTTLFVDGNHENHAALDELRAVKWHGGKVHIIKDNIIHLMRGQVYNIDGCNIFTMGGAESHDKQYRVKDVSWWEREMPSVKEYKTAKKNLMRVQSDVDIILSHCGPYHIIHSINDYFAPDELTVFFDTVSNQTKFKHWFFGHYHEDVSIEDGKYFVVYNKIIAYDPGTRSIVKII